MKRKPRALVDLLVRRGRLPIGHSKRPECRTEGGVGCSRKLLCR
jgi:hypothetical protein